MEKRELQGYLGMFGEPWHAKDPNQARARPDPCSHDALRKIKTWLRSDLYPPSILQSKSRDCPSPCYKYLGLKNGNHNSLETSTYLSVQQPQDCRSTPTSLETSTHLPAHTMSTPSSPYHPSTSNDPTSSEISESDVSKQRPSRSQSRRARRRKAQQKQQMAPVAEDREESNSPSPEASSKVDISGFINGVAMHHDELPLRGANPNQGHRKNERSGRRQSDEMEKQDGLKLLLELNLDIELELKASIRGDVTLALL